MALNKASKDAIAFFFSARIKVVEGSEVAELIKKGPRVFLDGMIAGSDYDNQSRQIAADWAENRREAEEIVAGFMGLR